MSNKDEIVSDIVKDVVTNQIIGKKFYYSKTFWANVVMLGALAAQTKFGFVFSPELQALAVSLINVGLRKITKEPVIW